MHKSNGSILDTFKTEAACHLPYGILSVALALIVTSILSFIVSGKDISREAGVLFHSLHFTHILFASTGVVLTYRKYARSIIGSIIVGTLVPAVFCSLSDAFLPYIGCKIFGINVHFHWCFRDHLSSILPYLTAGIVCGLLISSRASKSMFSHSVFAHFSHSFVSALASLFYIISHGYINWHHQMGFMFVVLLVAVILPCTLSDLIVPVFCAHVGNNGSNSNLEDSDNDICCSEDHESEEDDNEQE